MSEEVLERKMDGIVDSVALLESMMKAFDKEKALQGQVQAWSEKLEKLYEDFHQVTAELEAYPRGEGEDPVSLKTERQKFDVRYYTLRAFYISQLTAPASVATSSQAPKQPFRCVKLPELHLPKFSGKLEDWCAFRDSFESAIGSRADIGAIEKLQYLRSCVEGEAERLLEPIKTSERGYKDAWRTLRLRYENKRQLIKCHIRKLFEVPPMKRESADELLAVVDRFEQQISVLKSLGEPADKWSSLLVYHLSTRLDPRTLRTWESHCAKMDSENVAAVLGGIAAEEQPEVEGMPSYISMVNFLQNHARVLHAAPPVLDRDTASSRDRKPKFQKSGSYAAASTSSTPSSASSGSSNRKCFMQCDAPHFLYHCPKFLKLDFNGKHGVVKHHKLCLNCLRSTTHFARDCPAQHCRRCTQKHHTLLHIAKDVQPSSEPDSKPEGAPATGSSAAPAAAITESSAQVACVASAAETISEIVLLPTALIHVRDSRGHVVAARCLLDSASQHNFIAQRLCDRLNLPRVRLPVPMRISGIGGVSTSVTHHVVAALSSRVSPYALKATALVLPNITVQLPQNPLDARKWPIPDHVDLADPTFGIPGDVDIILGSAHFFRVLRFGSITIGDQLPTLQRTEFGWVVSGGCTLDNHDHSDPRTCHFSCEPALENLVHRFWTLEELHDTKGWSPSERYCEKHYLENTTRNAEGRYIVKHPKKEELLSQLDNNRYNATRRFYSLERSLAKDPQKKAMYFKFIEEYLALGHMREVKPEEMDIKPQYHLPHHAVMKMDSATTKLRSVFDASCEGRSGLSLNDILMSGPTVQDDLVSLVLRFRMHRFVVSADIEKMFRQILVHPCDQPLLRILWRDNPDSPLKTFQLLTVTYGTNSAPFLSTRTLQKLADDEEPRFPLAAPAVRHDFYVDNLLTGADSVQDLIAVCSEVMQMMKSACLPLRQWSSNNQEVLDTIPVELRETQTILELDRESFVATLGLRWEPATDQLSFKQPKWTSYEVLTKRVVLSHISSLFDPLGLVGPFNVKLKILLQALWKLQLDWDAAVPHGFTLAWTELVQSINLLSQLKIPRYVVTPNYARLEIHGFCDASLAAYGACLFLRSVMADGSYTVQLLAAKSRVAPLGSQSIPRLELCAALLLAHLLVKFTNSVDLHCPVFLWTDSTIVLNWLASTPSTLETYVGNRSAEVQELTAHAKWNHVASGDNPADLISRGTSLDTLLKSTLWWHGAPWLLKPEEEWPRSSFVPSQNFDMGRKKTVAFPAVVENDDIVDRFSTLHKLLRTCSWMHRFKENCRRRSRGEPRVDGPLTPEEVDHSLHLLLRKAQEQHFAPEIRLLENNQQVKAKSKLRFLHPQLIDGLIRVGGRLHNARIPVDAKHPIVLPKKHRLTGLIVRNRHLKTRHGGPQLLLSTLRQEFWPLGGRDLVRQICHNCFTCTRYRPTPLQQLMGDLPHVRVNKAYPFQNVGIDYAGPVYIRAATTRRTTMIKAYIAVFVCLATKAVHLELVTSLTTEEFIACLHRFIARRSKPSNIYCDNAQTFVGAHRELADLRRQFISQQHREAVANQFAEDGIHFHFIPPRSPNVGGIWEACVKSTKILLRKILGNANLTESEFVTALTQVEAQLNSRPITPIPNSPDDELALTPGHFLVLRPLNAVAEPDLTTIPENRLSRWQRVQRLTRHFWNRWHREYLQTLQNRYRWSTQLDNVLVGSIVALMDERLPPQKWALGRVTGTRPGHDGLVRIVTVRTRFGETDRQVSKLCLLPTEIDPANVSAHPNNPGSGHHSASADDAERDPANTNH